MKTPITYWGGKQQLVPKILSLIPEHKQYCEPFFGGGALYFAKNLAKLNLSMILMERWLTSIKH